MKEIIRVYWENEKGERTPKLRIVETDELFGTQNALTPWDFDTIEDAKKFFDENLRAENDTQDLVVSDGVLSEAQDE